MPEGMSSGAIEVASAPQRVEDYAINLLMFNIPWPRVYFTLFARLST